MLSHININKSANWVKTNSYEYLLCETDKETNNEIEHLISILQPYLNRNETERTNILLKARSITEKQRFWINI